MQRGRSYMMLRLEIRTPRRQCSSSDELQEERTNEKATPNVSNRENDRLSSCSYLQARERRISRSARGQSHEGI